MIMHLLTGFGTPDTEDFVRFNVLVDRVSGIVPDWNVPLRTVSDPIIGSSHAETQILGFDVATVDHTLLFACRNDYFRLQTMLGNKRTLVLTASYSRFPGEVRTILGHDYEYHHDILLVNLVAQFRTGATVARATFQRSAGGLGVGQW